MAAQLKILSAARAKPLADRLAAQLGAREGVTVLLLTPELADDPQKDAVARQALDALAQQSLVLVQAGDAEAPLGLRDLPRLPWAPEGAESSAQIAAIESALEASARAAPAPVAAKRKKRGGLVWIIAGVVALILLALFVFSSSLFMAGAPMQGAAPSTDELPAPAPGSNSVANAITAALAQLDDAMAAQDFQPLGQQNTQLQQGAHFEVPVNTVAGVDYRIGAVCDADCSDLDLQLLDASGASVAADAGSSATPVLSFTAQQTGDLTLRVTMATCTVQPCYLALALYGRNSAAAPNTPSTETPLTAPPPTTDSTAQLDARFEEIRGDLMLQVFNLRDMRESITRLTWLIGALIALQMIILMVVLWPRGEKRERKSKTRAAANSGPEPAAAGGLFFASYSRKDREQVDAVIDVIEREGLPIWLDRIDIGGGATWPEAIVQAIRGARGVIVFCSGNAFDSDNVLREINLAASYNKPLLPILIAPSNIPDSFLYYLSTQQMVDPSSDQQWREKVLQSLKDAA